MQPKAFTHKVPGVGNSTDPDAAIYIARAEAAGRVFTTALKSAISTFYKLLKGQVNPGFNRWADVLDLKLYTGTTAAINRLDGKNSAFDANFFGGITHNANGITGNAATGYYTFNFLPDTEFAAAERTYVNYCRNNASGAYALFGSVDSSFNGDTCYPDFGGLTYFSLMAGVSGGAATVGAAGINIFTRNGPADEKMYKNGALVYNKNAPFTFFSEEDLARLARNFAGAIDRHSPYNFCFDCTIKGGLSAAEVAILTPGINTLQTAFGRNIY